MREAKLTINIEGILKECQSLDRNDISITSVKEINYMNILKRILKDNLKIESEELSEKKKETILKIIENDICQHFIYSLAERSIMQKISPELLSGTEERIKYAFISLATELIRPNQLMYNPSHGITREFDMYGEVDNIVLSYGELDLSTRTCTLMVDDTNLENILQLTLEDMDRENAYHVSYKVDSKGMELFKKYTSVKGRYILDDLYTQEKDKVPLIDYGLKLIYEKYHLINDLIKYIKEMESPSNNNKVQDIPEKLSNLFENEELEMVFSILNNKEKIWNEKMIYNNMLKSFDYMASNTDILGGKGEQKVLKIKADLSNFSEDYIRNHDVCLLNILSDKGNKLYSETESLSGSVNIEEEKWDKKEKSLTEWKNTTELDPNSQEYQEVVRKEKDEMRSILREINFLHNKIFSSNRDIEKGISLNKVVGMLPFTVNQLANLSPGQKQYLLKKIKELAKLLKVQVVVTDEAEAAEKMEVDEPVEQHQTLEMSDGAKSSTAGASARTSTLGKVLTGGLLVLGSMAYVNHHSKSKSSTAANSDNNSLYHVMDSSQLRNMNSHNIS